jgi:hypothetical protein
MMIRQKTAQEGETVEAPRPTETDTKRDGPAAPPPSAKIRRSDSSQNRTVAKNRLHWRWTQRTLGPSYAPDLLSAAARGEPLDRSGKPLPWRWERSLCSDLLGPYGLVLTGAVVMIAAIAYIIPNAQVDQAGRPAVVVVPSQPPPAQSSAPAESPAPANPSQLNLPPSPPPPASPPQLNPSPAQLPAPANPSQLNLPPGPPPPGSPPRPNPSELKLLPGRPPPANPRQFNPSQLYLPPAPIPPANPSHSLPKK